ncbi:uncharacterized protein EDB93DRAFT_1169978 [Suillus bovinus]|uniref:uncharacterized protein n=1 Tax=Suillus bovinus TaxID=48563 RepID=UPI001B86B9D8|nr:uncharacterized protein EDB93DRAFT_1169978 [Suillus bovinus]KAG2136117.1 hypothetical protein EDB93DRAFT_1169978 [Suillus bovinus]
MLWRSLMHKESEITCSDDIGRTKTHGQEQRYLSPTTGLCRKLIVQAVTPSGKFEVPIKDETSEACKLAIWLLTHCPVRGWIFFKWIRKFFWLSLKLLIPIIWFLVELYFNSGNSGDDAESSYNTGYYRPYLRRFQGQLWAARSRREHSSRLKGEPEMMTRTHACYPRTLMIRSPNRTEWVRCTDRDAIIHSKYIAISYRADDVYPQGSDQKEKMAQFIDDVRAAVLRQQFDAYWLDLECLGKTESEKNLDVYCMADVYRRAETTLIMLGRSEDGERKCWSSWGGRIWTFPEALLSSRLCYKFRDREEINSLSLFQLANLAYSDSEDEQAVINAYGNGKDPLERLERLALLKKAIWRRAMARLPKPSGPPPPPKPYMIGRGPITGGGYTPHKAERVYALMGFFEHRIQPTRQEDEFHALARLSMANDNDRITERMVSMFPLTTTQGTGWYADDDIYHANLWDILPEIQVAGVTEKGALVLDGCRAAAIRWKNFPDVVFANTYSLTRTFFGSIPYFSWPCIVVGIALEAAEFRVGGFVFIAVGLLLLFLSPLLLVFGRSGRIVTAQPWLIGVKGVIDRKTAESHLYGGTVAHFPKIAHLPTMLLTPSGSPLSIPEQLARRKGSDKQYEDAKEEAKSGPGHMYTLVDTYSSTMYYFRAERPPTVCIFAGREGGLGRFVLCSENCKENELRKEMVLRMPTEISQRMELCGWVALG